MDTNHYLEYLSLLLRPAVFIKIHEKSIIAN